MVIAKIQGGLGNQMFQYAFGRMLALRNNTKLKLDTTMFEGYIHRYTMDHLNITDVYATQKEIGSFTRYRTRNTRLGRWFLNPLSADPKRYVIEPTFTFAPQMVDLKAPCMVDGYWLCEQYFLEIEDTIRKEFTLRQPPGPYTRSVEAKIASAENPVVLHVRRGDFAHHPTYSKVHGTCSPEYYKEAMNTVRERVQNPSYFVFSDEPKWAREHIKTEFPTEYIGQGPEKNYEDLHLMTLCKHFILANSTFGWWGAWLSKGYRNNITIMPKYITTKREAHDLAHKSWTIT